MIIYKKYIQEIKNTKIPINIIEKDLILSYILQELSYIEELIFKGGTCLSKCYLDYHRFSEDLDFNLEISSFDSKTKRKKDIRNFFKNNLLPKIDEIAEKYGFEFDSSEFSKNGEKYCPVKNADNIFIFYIYNYDTKIKLEINVSQKRIFDIEIKKIKNINPNSKYLIYPLKKIDIKCYSLEEIALEKIRAILTRKEGISERDIFDLFLINKKINVFKLQDKHIKTKLKESLFRFNGTNIESYKLFEEVNILSLTNFNKEEYISFFEKLKKKLEKYKTYT
jgi:predicted nucleotidyltransferase component of viral defense system